MFKSDNILVPLIEEGLDKRFIPFVANWLPYRDERPFRFSCLLGDEIPALVELGVPKEGIQWVHWALWPVDDEIAFGPNDGAEWPGAAWGTGAIDRRLNFSISPYRDARVRKDVRPILSSLPDRSTEELRMSIGWAT